MRLFIAIQLTDEIKDKLCGAMELLRQTTSGGKFPNRDNLHLTLAFIGETNRLDAVRQAMDAARSKPFLLTLDTWGRFQRNGGDIYWVGIQPSEELLLIHCQLSSALSASGFQLERREYHPHLTIGRKVVPLSKFDKSDLNALLDHQTMSVQSIHLMKSENCNGKLIYTSIYQKNLSKLK